MNMIHNQDFDIPAADAATLASNTIIAGRQPTDEEIAAFRAQAHRLRAAYVGKAVRNLWSAFTHRVRAARARNQLAALPDYILHDFGLSRAEIPAAVAGDRSLRRHSEPAVAAVDLASTTKPAEEKLAA